MKPKLLFLYELADNLYAQDGLHSAIEILREEFDITKANIKEGIPELSGYDYVLGHGGWSGSVDNLIKANLNVIPKCGLCIGGNINPPESPFLYSNLFCETNWYLPQIESHPNVSVAFGINTDIFYNNLDGDIIFDYLGVGSFAKWKRWELMGKKKGNRLIVGEIQKYNPIESMGIVGMLIANGIGVMPNVDPTTLLQLYNATDTVYLPSTVYGGGERAVWEALSCGCRVECEEDNPKLQELIESPVKSHFDYAKALLAGIKKTL